MKDRRITIRLTQDEYDSIIRRNINDTDKSKDKKKQNLSRYIRNIVLAESGHSDWRVDKELNQLNYEIRKIGLNVNQIARKLNAGMGDPRDADYALELLNDIKNKLESFEEKVKNNMQP